MAVNAQFFNVFVYMYPKAADLVVRAAKLSELAQADQAMAQSLKVKAADALKHANGALQACDAIASEIGVTF